MSTFDTLPIVLVSTATQADATSVLSELINDDVTAEYNKETQSADRVWRLINKYYSADVRVHALIDDQTLSLDPNCVEAHIIHITEDEAAEGVAAAEWAPRRRPPPRGVERARQALHAHVWPNLRRAGAAARAPPVETASDTESGSSSDSEPWVESESAELRAVERAEQFAAALGALGELPRARDLPPLPRDARLDHAEELVAAFCRALGLEPDA